MTITTEPPAAPVGRKDWQAARHAPDHGRTAAIAIGYQLLARHLTACAAEDMQILGVTELPDPRPYMVPVTRGTDEERKARVDAFAARHGVTAGYDDTTGTYRATVKLGLVTYVAYMITEGRLTERLAAIHADIAAMHPGRAA